MLRVVHLASGREWRGGQRQVLILARGLTGLPEVESTVVTGEGSALARRLTAARVSTFMTPWSIGLDPRVAFFAMGALQPNSILHAHDSHAHTIADALSRMRGYSPVVVTRRVVVPIRNPQRYQRASAVIAISGAVRDLLVRARIDPAKIHLVPDAVDRADLDQVRPWPDSVAPFPPDRPTIVCIAALTREKGVDLLVAAAAALRTTHPSAHWIVLGEGPERGALEAQAATLGVTDRVSFAGFVPHPERVLREATVAVQPSRAEGLGSSVLDALALGIPVVATRAGGLPDALAHGGGVLVAGEPAELSRAVAHLLDDGAARAALSTAGRAAAREFSVERLVERTLDVYRSVAGSRGAQ